MKDLRYLTDSYDEKIKRINAIDAPLNLVFITDMHNGLSAHATDAVESIRYILDRCPGISMVISGGDIGNDYHPDPHMIRASQHEIMDALYRLPVPVHCCVGNHDDALGVAIEEGRDTVPRAILPAEMHELCMRNNPTPENYYYIDHDTTDGGCRIVFLNTADKAYYLENGQYPLGWHLELSDRQVRWLEEDALKTDRPILIFAHSPLRNAHIFGTDGTPPYIKPYDDLRNGPRAYYAVKQCKNAVAVFAGHVHYDNIVYDEDLVTVTTLCALSQEWAPGCPKRVVGTPTETAFDVISVKGSALHITRFGAGEDRQATLSRMPKR